MSDIDEGYYVRPTTGSIAICENEATNMQKSGVLIRRSIDEGMAIWYISQYGMKTDDFSGSFVSACVDKQE